MLLFGHENVHGNGDSKKKKKKVGHILYIGRKSENREKWQIWQMLYMHHLFSGKKLKCFECEIWVYSYCRDFSFFQRRCYLRILLVSWQRHIFLSCTISTIPGKLSRRISKEVDGLKAGRRSPAVLVSVAKESIKKEVRLRLSIPVKDFFFFFLSIDVFILWFIILLTFSLWIHMYCLGIKLAFQPTVTNNSTLTQTCPTTTSIMLRLSRGCLRFERAEVKTSRDFP